VFYLALATDVPTEIKGRGDQRIFYDAISIGYMGGFNVSDVAYDYVMEAM
jgi:hypothetical protein